NDYVVLDGPSRLDAGARAVFDMADVNLLVMQLIVTSVRNTDRILQELGRHGYNLDRVQLICNRATRESGHLELEHVQATLDRQVFWSIPDDFKTVSGAINLGEPLAVCAARSKVRQSIRDLARRFCDSPDGREDGAAGKKSAGVLRKLLSG
ncbi:MAG: CpaE family protein, partial [Phycisphaerae bacterium]